MENERMTQREYDKAMLALRDERTQEYNKLDQRALANERQLQFLHEQRKEIAEKLRAVELSNKEIMAERNEICRRYNEKQLKLRKLRDDSLGAPKELSSTVAYRLHNAVEKALKEALAEHADICIEGIKCNYNYDDDGKIDFFVNIPKQCKTE